jgi:hypothetical protein
LVEVAQPMLDAPPAENRPAWKAGTIVLPETKVSGSAPVLC